jgi:hypothetical protein
MATGALVLAVSAIFATKANKKFAFSFKTGFASQDHNFSVKTVGDALWLTTSGGTGLSPAIVTVQTSAANFVFKTQLVTGTHFSHRLYY